jgi:hypothetical protein
MSVLFDVNSVEEEDGYCKPVEGNCYCLSQSGKK